VGKNALEEKLPELQRALQDCQQTVDKMRKERHVAWEQWRTAHEESASSRLLRQHMQAEQQLQRALDAAMGQMQVHMLHKQPFY
jgi:F0F1-type ATP synthase membrane subunit b/b'